MRESFQSPVSPLLMASVVAVIFLTALAWVWAVRRPAPVVAPAEARPLVYAAIGASDVVGVGADDPAAESWVNMVHRRMPEGTRFVRLGRGGITLREAAQSEVPQAIAARPDIITIWNCVNDLPRVPLIEYIRDLKSTLDRLTRETQASIVLLNVPDISLVMPVGPEQRALMQGGIVQWNAAIASTAAEYGGRVKVVDLYPISDEVLDHPEYLSPDNFHPSTKGYARLSEVVWEAIEREGLLKEQDE